MIGVAFRGTVFVIVGTEGGDGRFLSAAWGFVVWFVASRREFAEKPVFVETGRGRIAGSPVCKPVALAP